MNLRMILTAIIVLQFTAIMAQSVTPDNRLEHRYKADYLQTLAIENPRQLDYLNFSIDQAWFIDESLGEKYESLPLLKFIDNETGLPGNAVSSIDTENLNIFSFYFEQGHKNRMYYRVGDTGIILGFYSIEELSELYNKAKGLYHE